MISRKEANGTNLVHDNPKEKLILSSARIMPSSTWELLHKSSGSRKPINQWIQWLKKQVSRPANIPWKLEEMNETYWYAGGGKKARKWLQLNPSQFFLKIQSFSWEGHSKISVRPKLDRLNKIKQIAISPKRAPWNVNYYYSFLSAQFVWGFAGLTIVLPS